LSRLLIALFLFSSMTLADDFRKISHRLEATVLVVIGNNCLSLFQADAFVAWAMVLASAVLISTGAA